MSGSSFDGLFRHVSPHSDIKLHLDSSYVSWVDSNQGNIKYPKLIVKMQISGDFHLICKKTTRFGSAKI